MRVRWTNLGWTLVAVLGLVAAGCGGDKHEKAEAKAEPPKQEKAAPPPKAAPAPPPPPAAEGPTSAPPDGPPGSDGPPDRPERPDHHGKGKHGGGKHGGPPEGPGDRNAKAGPEHDKSQKVIHLGRARMEFNHPGSGWTERKKNAWTMFAPKDKSSVLGFVEFDAPGEATSRIGQISSHLELTNINWRGNGEERSIGPQHLRAHFAEGTCKVAHNHHDCEIEYYTVEGALLIVYAFETDVKKVAKKERVATRSVETLRRY
jgi:hypothetical protein